MGTSRGYEMYSDCNLELVQVLRSAIRGDLELDAQEVCETFSSFFQELRIAQGPASERPWHSPDERFSRDDGVVVLAAVFDNVDWLELRGYIWWIDQAVDPLWARLHVPQDAQAGIANYTIKCGVRRPGDAGYSRAVAAASGQKYLKNLFEYPTNDHVADAWISEQLTPEVDLWYFEFSNISPAI